jgi:hypothetical protein
MEDDKTDQRTTDGSQGERMIEQDLGQAPEASHLMAEDTALQLFQIAALMLGDEQEAVSLVEESVAKVETDPCAEGTLAYAEARACWCTPRCSGWPGYTPKRSLFLLRSRPTLPALKPMTLGGGFDRRAVRGADFGRGPGRDAGMAGTAGAGPAGNFCAARGGRTRR